MLDSTRESVGFETDFAAAGMACGFSRCLATESKKSAGQIFVDSFPRSRRHGGNSG